MGESLALSFLPLLGGYYFATVEHRRAYRLARESGYRFYFAVACYAFWLLFLSIIVAFALHYASAIAASLYIKYPEGGFSIRQSCWDTSLVATYEELKVRIFLLTFFGGRFVADVWNRRHNFTKEVAIIQAIENNDFEKMILRGLNTDLPILFTLQSRKVYLGWAVKAPDPRSERRWVRILPMASGFRSEDTHELAFATDYTDVLERVDSEDGFNDLDIEDFEIVLPVDQIVSAHLFDVVAYFNWDAEEGEEEVAEDNG